MIEVEHDPETCEVCRRLGDWSVATDTLEWCEEHDKADIHVHVRTTASGVRVTEEKKT